MSLENTAVTNDTPSPDGDAVVQAANLESLNDLLVDDPKPSDDGAQGAAVGNDKEKNAKPEMFNDLAESLGVELDDLYNLKVTTSDGETVTIQELKSLQGKQDDIVLRELEFEETRASKEGDLRQAQNELAEVVAALPDGTLKPEVMEKLRAKNAKRIEVEQSRTLKAIPTWNDDATRENDMKGMAMHLERFGFPANYLASIVDHRQWVFIRESFHREQRIKNALAKVRAGAPNPTTPTKTAGKAPGKTDAKPKNQNTRNGLEQFFSDV